jgi:hypothetical protein
MLRRLREINWDDPIVVRRLVIGLVLLLILACANWAWQGFPEPAFPLGIVLV